MVEFDVAGSADDVSDFISELYRLVSAGLTVTFDGTDFTTLDELYVDNEVCRQSCLCTWTSHGDVIPSFNTHVNTRLLHRSLQDAENASNDRLTRQMP